MGEWEKLLFAEVRALAEERDALLLVGRVKAEAASNTGSREPGSSSGTPVSDNPGDTRGQSDADAPPTDTAAALRTHLRDVVIPALAALGVAHLVACGDPDCPEIVNANAALLSTRELVGDQ